MATTSPNQTSLWANTPGSSVSCSTASGGTTLLVANQQRQGVWITNGSSTAGNILWLSLGGTAATGAGIGVQPSSSWFSNQFSGQINGIATNATISVGISEI